MDEQIVTEKDLGGLPDGTVIVDHRGYAYQRQAHVWRSLGENTAPGPRRYRVVHVPHAAAGEVVTTVEELEALPPTTVIAQFFPANERYGHPPGILVYCRVYPGSYRTGWESLGDESIFSSDILVNSNRTPPRVFRVLYRPDKEE